MQLINHILEFRGVDIAHFGTAEITNYTDGSTVTFSGRTQKALDLLVNTYYNLDASDVSDRQLLAYSYEEFAVPYIKQLLADNKVATAQCGAGTAPESSLIDRSMPVGFNKINTFVGMGGSYFVNRWITLALSGTWYTMLSQSERLTTTYIANDPYIREDYSNYFYVHGSEMISF